MSSKKSKVIISGTSSGLGKALTDIYLSQGYEVVGIARNSPYKKKSYMHITADLSVQEDIEKVIEEIHKNHQEFDLLINNAATLYTAYMENFNIKQLISSYSVNVFSHMRITGALLKLIKNNKADIINLTSSSLKGTYPGFIPYSTAKAAFHQFTKELNSSLLESKSRVTEICPSGFQSNIWKNMTGLSLNREENKRMRVENIANIVYYISTLPKEVQISDVTIKNKKKHRPE